MLRTPKAASVLLMGAARVWVRQWEARHIPSVLVSEGVEPNPGPTRNDDDDWGSQPSLTDTESENGSLDGDSVSEVGDIGGRSEQGDAEFETVNVTGEGTLWRHLEVTRATVVLAQETKVINVNLCYSGHAEISAIVTFSPLSSLSTSQGIGAV